MFRQVVRPFQRVRFYSSEPPLMVEVRNSLKAAMRSGDTVGKTTIRAVMAAVKNANIEKPDSVSTDLGLHGLLTSLISKREKSIEEYIKGNREDLAEGERAEIKVLQALQSKIPVASAEEIDAKVKEFIDGLGIEGKIPMGKVLSKLDWPEVEASWKASQKSVVASVKRVLGARSFSTNARQLSHENPLGIPRRRPNQSIISKQRIKNVKNVLLVSSAKGGVGKSTVAVNLALGLYMNGYSAGVLDVDIFGPSIPTLLKINGEPKITAEGNLVPLVNYGIKAMSMGFLVPPDRAVAWRGLLVQKALQQLLFEVDWDELDYLVIDMPPGTGDVQLTIAQQLEVDGAIIVSTPQDIALIDAVRGIDMFNTVKIPIVGLVQNMSVFVCPHCAGTSHIFGHDGAIVEAKKRGIDVLASLPLSADIAQGGHNGLPVVFEDPKESPSARAYLDLASSVSAKLRKMQMTA